MRHMEGIGDSNKIIVVPEEKVAKGKSNGREGLERNIRARYLRGAQWWTKGKKHSLQERKAHAKEHVPIQPLLRVVQHRSRCPLGLGNLQSCRCSERAWKRPWTTWPTFGVSPAVGRGLGRELQRPSHLPLCEPVILYHCTAWSLIAHPSHCTHLCIAEWAPCQEHPFYSHK